MHAVGPKDIGSSMTDAPEIGTKFKTFLRISQMLAMHLLREYHERLVEYP